MIRGLRELIDVIESLRFEGVQAVREYARGASHERSRPGFRTCPCSQAGRELPRIFQFAREDYLYTGAGGGTRTRTTFYGPGILSPVRLPFRHTGNASFIRDTQIPSLRCATFVPVSVFETCRKQPERNATRGAEFAQIHRKLPKGFWRAQATNPRL
jgi:hypothetical protein